MFYERTLLSISASILFIDLNGSLFLVSNFFSKLASILFLCVKWVTLFGVALFQAKFLLISYEGGQGGLGV